MIGPIKGDTGRLDCVYIGMYRGFVGDYRVSGLTTRFWVCGVRFGVGGLRVFVLETLSPKP